LGLLLLSVVNANLPVVPPLVIPAAT